MAGLYLTIDDSPSGVFPQLCDFLKERSIPAAFFMRGDLMTLYPQRVVQAIKDGFMVANHSWSHYHASRLDASLGAGQVVKTQKYIDDAYEAAGIARPGPYMRFPHMDSGLGSWPLPPEAFTAEEQQEVRDVYMRFYRSVNMEEPDDASRVRHRDIEIALRDKGFSQMDFQGVRVPWYLRYAESSAVSTQGTFCHPDWILAGRHKGKLPDEERSVEALNRNFDQFLAANPGNHILVMHDSVELWPHFQKLIKHMLDQGHSFLPIPA